VWEDGTIDINRAGIFWFLYLSKLNLPYIFVMTVFRDFLGNLFHKNAFFVSTCIFGPSKDGP